MRFSIVIPTYNEEQDIRRTLEAALQAAGADTEIIVVDDSIDRTPDILREFEPREVKVMRQEKPEGRSSARNLGIRAAAGDVVVLLNADVLLPADFLRRLAPHYEAGADYVLVESRIANPASPYARYVEAEGVFYYGASGHIEWTEGFSARRQGLLQVGGFPVGLAVPMSAGEDGYVGEKLRAAKFKKVIDRSIVVTHFAPDTLTAYWHQQIGRGRGISQVRVLLRGVSIAQAMLRMVLKTAWTLVRVLTLAATLHKAWQLAGCSPGGRVDFPAFWAVSQVQTLAQLLGEWRALLEIRQALGRGQLPLE